MLALKNNSKLILGIFIAQFVWCSQSIASQKTGSEATEHKVTPPSSMVINVADKVASVVDDKQLQEARNIADAGAPSLALRMMDRVQQDIHPQVLRWMIWEELRLNIYETNQDWDSVINRADQLPATVSKNFFLWVRTQKAQAYLQLQKGKQAREQLRALILSTSGDRKSVV